MQAHGIAEAPGEADGDARLARWRRRATSIEVAAVAGFVCAAGWSIALRGLVGRPALGASREEVLRYYAHESPSTVAPLLALLVVGTVGYLWFVGVVRSRLGFRESRLVGSVFLGASVLLAGLVLLGGATLAAPSMASGNRAWAVDPDAIRLFRAESVVVMSVFAPRVATLVMFSAASLGRATGALPRWLVVGTYVVGAAEFVNVTIGEPTLYVFPAWMGIVSAVLLLRRADVAAGPPTEAPAAAARSAT